MHQPNYRITSYNVCYTKLLRNGHGSTENYLYAVLIVIASLFYGTNVNLIKKYLSDLHPLTISVGNFSIMMIPAILVLYFSDFFSIAHQPEVQTSLFFIGILGMIGTGISNMIFFKLIQISSPVFASSVTYIIPVVAIFLGTVFMGESMNVMQIVITSYSIHYTKLYDACALLPYVFFSFYHLA